MKGYSCSCVDRFLQYVKFDTQSSEESSSFPSTEKQKELGRYLVKELQELGMQESVMDEWGYVTAVLPGNTEHAVPVIGLIAHMDTSPDVSGKGVNAMIHLNYAGGDLVLSTESGVVIKADENPLLGSQIGNDIITSDGTTLLGADNKAGIAEIMDALAYLVSHPEIEHGTIKVAITPDEEVGRGTEHFDVEKFGADYAYTIDGETAGEIEDETFCADSAIMTVTGVNVHPGYAKNKLVNAIKIASQVIDKLPADRLSPENTEKREGYLHPHAITGSVESVVVKFLVRDFTVEGLKEKEAFLQSICGQVAAKHSKAKIELKVEESYRNMKYMLDRDPRVVEYAVEAIAEAGLTPIRNIIRGGTDGARLSFAGLLTPNLFTGGHNFHSRQEWISVQDMQKAVDVIVKLVQVWVKKSPRHHLPV
ncbi:MAG TPA: peptidase T [bacterium]|nr:peptidase T [bacterium]HPG45205.1 peptidase T [bacterium]HPM97447.1 peptidase T [bacterium]